MTVQKAGNEHFLYLKSRWVRPVARARPTLNSCAAVSSNLLRLVMGKASSSSATAEVEPQLKGLNHLSEETPLFYKSAQANAGLKFCVCQIRSSFAFLSSQQLFAISSAEIWRLNLDIVSQNIPLPKLLLTPDHNT